jgi:hypothetical protein
MRMLQDVGDLSMAEHSSNMHRETKKREERDEGEKEVKKRRATHLCAPLVYMSSQS